MAVWVEELRVDNFKICFREAKIFDGPHKNIKIVSMSSWHFLSVVILIIYNYTYVRLQNIRFLR